MDVSIPAGPDTDAVRELVAREKSYSQTLQRGGEWLSIWRCVGEYANISIFDVASNDRLHEILWSLPLFPYMTIDVTPLAGHPSAISQGGVAS